MAKEIKVKLSADTAAANKALAQFGGTLEDVYEEGVQPLNFAIGELEDRLYEMAAAGQQGTQEFQDMAAEVGRMKKTIIDTDLAVDALSMNLAQTTAGAAAGVASVFEIGTGAMAAFGVESEQVEEQLLKVQSAMAMAQGLQGLKEGIQSFKALGAMIKRTSVVQKLLNSTTKAGTVAQWALNTAMNANPIGALILAITALVGAIVYFTSKANDAAEVNDKLTASIEKQNKKFDLVEKTIRKNMEQRMELLEATGATEEELHKERLAQIKTEEGIRKASLQNEKGQIMLKRAAYKRALEQGKDDLAREIKEEIQQSKDRYAELEAQNGDYHHNLKVENEKFRKEEEDRRKANYEKWLQQVKDEANKRLQARREIEDGEVRLIEQKDRQQAEQRRLSREREIQAVNDSEILREDEKRKRIQQINDYYDQQEFTSAMEGIDTIEMAKLERFSYHQNNELAQFQAHEKEKTRISKAEAKAQTSAWLQENEQKIGAATDLFSSFGELANAFADESEDAQRRAFNINKAVGIANAIINTSVGVTKALATLPPPVSFITAATTAASGAAQIATIAKSQFQGGGSGSDVSTSGLSSGASVSSRPAFFNVVGNTGNNQLAQTLGDTPLKTYVVAGEVTTAQSLERNKIETASL